MLGISSAVLSLARQQATLQPQDAEDPRCAELDKRLDLADLSVQSFAGATYCAGSHTPTLEEPVTNLQALRGQKEQALRMNHRRTNLQE